MVSVYRFKNKNTFALLQSSSRAPELKTSEITQENLKKRLKVV
jgi:hypothetical protein